MTLPPWTLLLLAVPVILLGELLVRRIKFLSYFNIPVPVAGGLIIALVVLAANLFGHVQVQFATKVDARWWTWLVTPEVEWAAGPFKEVQLPFLVGFFTCIGLNASWQLVRNGGWQVIVLLGLATVLAISQNILGIVLARSMHVSPLIGVVCGGVTLTGGPGTALGFAHTLEEAGLPDAAVIGVAAATFGIFISSLVGGPVAGRIIRSRKLKTVSPEPVPVKAASVRSNHFLAEVSSLGRLGRKFWLHLLVLLFCIKAGAWLSYFMKMGGLTFPVYMGAMMTGMLVRNLIDLTTTGWLDFQVVSLMESVLLGLFIAMAMMSLNLARLSGAALPMTIILLAQVLLMILFARYVTFRFMGGDYEAAVMTSGHIGFGLGITPNAVANMKSMVETFGPSPRAFLVVPIVGAFLIDFTNALNINVFINWFKPVVTALPLHN